MAKSFKTKVDSTVSNKKEESEEPKQTDKEIRFTTFLYESQAEAMRDIAYWERLNVKEVFQAAVNDYLSSYKAKRKEGIKKRPEGR